jgi:hypothetical protein
MWYIYRGLHACNYMSIVRAHLCLFCSVKVMIMWYIYIGDCMPVTI